MSASAKDAEYSDFVAVRWLALVRAAQALGCSLAEAEDLAQVTMVKVYVSWAKVVRADHRDAYVAKMLVNAHRDTFRKRREAPIGLIADAAGHAEAGDFEATDAIRRAVARLSQGQREVVALRYFVRLTEPEIATVLGIAAGTVKSRLSRALDALSVDADLTDLRDGGTS